MKYTLILLLLPVFSLAQDTALSFTEVVEIPGQTKDQLFTKARQWFATIFKNSNAVLQINDKEAGELSGKGFMKSRWHNKQLGRKYPQEVDVWFQLAIYIKDGKYKYEINNLEAKHPLRTTTSLQDFGLLTSATKCPVKWPMVGQKKMDENWADLKSETELRIKELVESLKSAMIKESKTDF